MADVSGGLSMAGVVTRATTVARTKTGALAAAGGVSRLLQLYRTKTGTVAPGGDDTEAYKEALFYGVSHDKDPTGIER